VRFCSIILRAADAYRNYRYAAFYQSRRWTTNNSNYWNCSRIRLSAAGCRTVCICKISQRLSIDNELYGGDWTYPPGIDL